MAGGHGSICRDGHGEADSGEPGQYLMGSTYEPIWRGRYKMIEALSEVVLL